MSARFAIKEAILAIIGGITYVIIELIWRGHSHISMFILGGICFVVIGLINEVFPWGLGLLWQSLIGSVIITVCEFITGVIVNIWLGLGVWDYSHLAGNILGQICPQFTLLWLVLSVVGIVILDWMRYAVEGGEKPRYT